MWTPEQLVIRRRFEYWPHWQRALLLQNKLAWSDRQAAGMLALSGFVPEELGEADIVRYGREYRAARDRGHASYFAAELASAAVAAWQGEEEKRDDELPF